LDHQDPGHDVTPHSGAVPRPCRGRAGGTDAGPEGTAGLWSVGCRGCPPASAAGPGPDPVVGPVAGNRMVKVEPCPTWLQTTTSPPRFAQTCLTIDSPRPVPPVARDRAASTR